MHALRLVASPDRLLRPAAANAGLDAAAGDWITFLDDDDLFLPDHLAGPARRRRDGTRGARRHLVRAGRFRDGHVEWFGHPFSLSQLYERNFIHLSAALFARELVAAGCRFDESFEILEDWEFMLQLAQRAAFHFVPLGSFQWNADAGDSGAAGGANHDAARFAANRDRIYAKWAAAQAALIERVAPKLEAAAARAQARDFAGAEALCRDALAVSANDPWALNLLAMALRERGRLADARAAQELAVAVRPQDASLVYNLALLARALGDLESARRHARRAATLAPDFAPARALAQALAQLPPPAPAAPPNPPPTRTSP